jgi:hypothetical protein
LKVGTLKGKLMANGNGGTLRWVQVGLVALSIVVLPTMGYVLAVERRVVAIEASRYTPVDQAAHLRDGHNDVTVQLQNILTQIGHLTDEIRLLREKQ